VQCVQRADDLLFAELDHWIRIRFGLTRDPAIGLEKTRTSPGVMSVFGVGAGERGISSQPS
jgi:hypothetical protein